MKKLLAILLFSGLCSAQTHTFPALDTNNVFTGTNTFNSTVSVQGTLTAKTEQGVPHCKDDFTAGVTAFQVGMAACVARLSATGTGTVDARDITDATNLTMTADWTMNRTATKILFGVYTVNQGTFRVIVPSTTNQVAFIGATPFVSTPLSAVNGTLFKYTGTGTAHSFGDSSAQSFGHLIEDIGCQVTSTAGAHCFDSTMVYGVEFNRVRGLSPNTANTNIFIQNNGPAVPGSQSMTVREVVENNFQTGYLCTGLTSPPGCNNIRFIGGQFSGNGLTGGIAIDIEAGNEINFLDPIIGGYDSGLKVASPSSGAVWGKIHMESCTTNGIQFTAAANSNWIWTDTTCPVTDANGTNTVINVSSRSLQFGFDGQTNRIKNNLDLPISFMLNAGITADQNEFVQYQDKTGANKWFVGKASDNSFVVRDSAASSLISIPQAGSGQTNISAPTTGTLDFNANSNNSGVARFLNTNGSVVGVQVDNTGTFKPGTAGAVGVGTNALPFSKIFIGAAATNNIQVTGTATGARTATFQDATGTVPLIIASGTSTFTTTAVTAGTCQTTVTTAATNALTSDTITTAYTTAPVAATDGVLTLQSYLTAGNVNFMRCNPTAGSITPTALVLNWRVIR